MRPARFLGLRRTGAVPGKLITGSVENGKTYDSKLRKGDIDHE